MRRDHDRFNAWGCWQAGDALLRLALCLACPAVEGNLRATGEPRACVPGAKSWERTTCLFLARACTSCIIVCGLSFTPLPLNVPTRLVCCDHNSPAGVRAVLYTLSRAGAAWDVRTTALPSVATQHARHGCGGWIGRWFRFKLTCQACTT